MKINKDDLHGLVKSFNFAFRGMWFCIKNERNMRIHLTALVIVSFFAWVYRLDSHEYILLAFAAAFVIVTEMVNTSIEVTVNLETTSYNHLAKIAKDIAAGAVLVAALASVVTGVVLFWNFPKLWDTVLHILTTPYLIISFALLSAVGVLFVFRGPFFFRRKTGLFASEENSEQVKIYNTTKKIDK